MGKVELAFISTVKLLQMSRISKCFNLGLTVKYVKCSFKMPITDLQSMKSNFFTAFGAGGKGGEKEVKVFIILIELLNDINTHTGHLPRQKKR